MQRLPIDILTITDWPAADQEAWARALAPAGFFDDRRSLSDLPKERLPVHRSAWGRWIGFLHAQSLEIRASGSAHFTEDRLNEFTQTLGEHLSPVTVRTYMTSLYGIARYMFPENDLGDLPMVTRSIQRNISCVGDRSVERFDAVTLSLWVDERLSEARKAKNRFQAAQLYRDLLAIKILILSPLRRKNLAQLEIGNTLNKEGARYVVQIAGRETKGKRYRAARMHASLSPHIDEYLDVWRPILMQARGRHWREPKDAFWISRDGGPMAAQTLGRRISDMMFDAFGERISPHRFRRIAATSISVAAPTQVDMIKAVLDHTTPRMSEMHYTRAGSAEAGFAFMDAIAEEIQL